MSTRAERAIHGAVRDALCERRAPVLLAVSGGMDSVSLLAAFARVAPESIAAVATFNHGTGAAGQRAVVEVRRYCERLQLPFATAQIVEPLDLRNGREAAWRGARYAFLQREAEKLGAVVATAHSEDDQIETVLMRLMRGSGARGLAGLYAPSSLCRPLLHLPRSVIAKYARAMDLTWVEDPSNSSREFFRNRVRHDLLPALRRMNPAIGAELLSVARQSAKLRSDVDAFIDRYLSVRISEPCHLSVRSEELCELSRDSLVVLWSSLASRVGLAADRRALARIAEFTGQSRCRGMIPIAGGWSLFAESGVYILERSARTVHDGSVDLPDSGSVEWGRFRFSVSQGEETESAWTASVGALDVVGVRNWTAGDRLAPSGRQPARRVKRYLSDSGIRGRDREGWPVVYAGDDVVWIPGVRRSDAATIRSGRPVRHYICERIHR